MNKIDITQPIQLDTGEPARFVGPAKVDAIGRPYGVVEIGTATHRRDRLGFGGQWLYYLDNGEWCNAAGDPTYKRIENVPAQPATYLETRDGRPARIVSEDGGTHNRPVVAVVSGPDGDTAGFYQMRKLSEGVCEGIYWANPPGGGGSADDILVKTRRPAPVVTHAYRRVSGSSSGLNGSAFTKIENARGQLGQRSKVLKLTYTDGEPTAAELVDA